jgi:hypothetical protein
MNYLTSESILFSRVTHVFLPLETLRLSEDSVYNGPQALLAQLDRASDYESEGREFESLRARF